MKSILMVLLLLIKEKQVVTVVTLRPCVNAQCHAQCRSQTLRNRSWHRSQYRPSPHGVGIVVLQFRNYSCRRMGSGCEHGGL